ncbi:GNAT family N-acetyltransferase [uncultured Pontibacter sp.]|uniref:GNAT family N-acetyltransferase n=1 Tax=uncultured Pontibacter sp. TaxID=453356 RepID=UPI00262FB8AC|nr:GNAT family N-acetyltransferase [uncultured Pontibacter sp.]
MDYTIRVANEQDVPVILELFELSLGVEGGAPVESFWRWKHVDNPFGPSPVLLAFNDGKLIGLRAFMRWQWVINGQVLPAFRAVDTATHPDYRGKGIFSKLTKRLLGELAESEPSSFIYNTPNEQSKPGYVKMGWQVLGKPNVTGSLALTYSAKAAEKFKAYHQSLQGFNFDVSSYLPVINQLHIHTNHAVNYHKWRFQSIPEIPYGKYEYVKDNFGVLLLFHLKKRGRFYELRICDELWLNGKNNTTVFLTACHTLAAELGTTFISYIGNEPLSLWSKIRYRTFPLQYLAPEVTIREVNDSNLISRIENLDDWSFKMGDLELF